MRFPAVLLAGALCINGHPAPRVAHPTYGGLPLVHGYERDHVVPLCLGGSDTRDNVRYQPLAIARVKDVDERAACRAYCSGKMSLEEAVQWLVQRWP
jgi:hypothetical protein